MKKRSTFVLTAVLFVSAVPASAVTITPDFSQLGSVYQDPNTGILFNTAGAGLNNVTAIFDSNVFTAINFWQNAILLPYNVTITFQLSNLTSDSAVGDSQITSLDANGRPMTTRIRVDDNTVPFYVDPTPNDNSEYNIVSQSAALGGGSVNVARFGNANSNVASNGYDLLSLLLHEIDHSLGFSSSTTRFSNAVTNGGTILVVPSTLSGTPSSYNVPINGTHIDGVAQNGLFNDTSIALPGFGQGQRALLTAVDIEALCTIEGCAANQINTNPSALSGVPEPGTFVLLSFGAPVLIGILRRRKQTK